MNSWLFAASAAALAIERVTYAVIWHRPDLFTLVCRRASFGRDPVDVLARLFAVFKVVQVLVFVSWCVVHGGGFIPPDRNIATLLGGGVMLAIGQALNLSVFARLGSAGVFYGNRLGHDVPWRKGFPFSWIRHPQYVGTVLSIWGFFVVMRYPAPDWLALPLLETLYYTLGSLVEQSPGASQIMADLSPPATAADPHAAEHLR